MYYSITIETSPFQEDIEMQLWSESVAISRHQEKKRKKRVLKRRDEEIRSTFS